MSRPILGLNPIFPYDSGTKFLFIIEVDTINPKIGISQLFWSLRMSLRWT